MIGPDYEQIQANPNDFIDFELVKRSNVHRIARTFGVPMRYWLQGHKKYILCSEKDCGHFGQLRWALDEKGNFIPDPEQWGYYCGMHYFEKVEVWTKNNRSE